MDITFDPTLFGYNPDEDIADFPSYEAFSKGAFQGREAAIRELQHPGSCDSCGHLSDCALHGRPAMPVEPCNCGAVAKVLRSAELEEIFGWILSSRADGIALSREFRTRFLPTQKPDQTLSAEQEESNARCEWMSKAGLLS